MIGNAVDLVSQEENFWSFPVNEVPGHSINRLFCVRFHVGTGLAEVIELEEEVADIGMEICFHELLEKLFEKIVVRNWV